MVEELLQLLVCEVNTQLLETIVLFSEIIGRYWIEDVLRKGMIGGLIGSK
jgi:hypothetical protein